MELHDEQPVNDHDQENEIPTQVQPETTAITGVQKRPWRYSPAGKVAKQRTKRLKQD